MLKSKMLRALALGVAWLITAFPNWAEPSWTEHHCHCNCTCALEPSAPSWKWEASKLFGCLAAGFLLGALDLLGKLLRVLCNRVVQPSKAQLLDVSETAKPPPGLELQAQGQLELLRRRRLQRGQVPGLVADGVAWHERRILAACACGRGWHVVLTPDFDMYPEQLSLENDDLAEFRIAPANDLPFGVNVGNSYRFGIQPGPPRLAQLRRDAAQAARALAFPPGAGPGLAAPQAPPLVQGAPVAAAPADAWVYVETDGVHERGALATLDGSEVLRGTVGLKQEAGVWRCIRNLANTPVADFKGREAACDARLMGIKVQDQKREERTWRDVSSELKEEKFDDWGVPGPRTSLWCARFLNRRNGGPIDHHRWWVATHQLKADSWGVAEHESLLKIVDKLGPFGGCSSSSTSTVSEVLVRARGQESRSLKRAKAMRRSTRWRAPFSVAPIASLGTPWLAPSSWTLSAKRLNVRRPS